MNLHEYFESTRGTGVLATASSAGLVDAAVYARPHVLSENTVAFIMADRLSHANLQTNPRAAFLFIEQGEGYRGVRLELTRTAESTDPARVAELRRRSRKPVCPDDAEGRFVVEFRVDRVRPLVGEGTTP